MNIVRRFSPDLQREIKDHINQCLWPLATPEKAKCARDRKNLWIEAEPDYAKGKYKPAHTDERLWRLCQNIYPSAALAQVYFAAGGHGIGWHGDGAFAKSEAYILNLGAVCLQTKLKNGELISLNLTGGEVIKFDCKLLHRSIPRSEDRIGIAIWSDAIPIDKPNNWIPH